MLVSCYLLILYRKTIANRMADAFWLEIPGPMKMQHLLVCIPYGSGCITFTQRKLMYLDNYFDSHSNFHLLLQMHQTGTQLFLKKHGKLLLASTNTSSTLSSCQDLLLFRHMKVINPLSEAKCQMN